jgi:hypothetical protein
MWPSWEHPDLGSFLVPVKRELEALGHEVEVVAISRRGGRQTKYGRLSGDAVRAAVRRRPDVVFAHFLFPAGAAGAFASPVSRAPLVVMAHGQDVANLGQIPGAASATRAVVARARAVIANSRWLAGRPTERIPSVASKLEVIDCGVDLRAWDAAGSPSSATARRVARGKAAPTCAWRAASRTLRSPPGSLRAVCSASHR